MAKQVEVWGLVHEEQKLTQTIFIPGEWYHVAGIVKGPTDMDIYVGCHTHVGTYVGSGGPLGYTNNPGSIGRKDANTTIPAHHFKGAIDDFYYWNRVITQTEIDSLCNNLILDTKDDFFQKFSVFPNPTSGILQIDTDVPDLRNLIIYNALGQTVFKGAFTSQIDMRPFPKGFYFLSVQSRENKQRITRRILLE